MAGAGWTAVERWEMIVWTRAVKEKSRQEESMCAEEGPMASKESIRPDWEWKIK